MTNRELERLYGREGRWEFHREETRRSKSRRWADCGHDVDAREPYRYSVGKVSGAHRLVQSVQCDHCFSAGRRS